MPHPLVTQLRFTRSEFVRCMEGVSSEDAVRRILPLNCLSWIVGHLAAQEQYLWLENGLGRMIDGDLLTLVGFGQPASTPPWDEMWTLWQEITHTADEFLDAVTNETLDDLLNQDNPHLREPVGILLLRNIYHYWHHLGEAHAIRQVLGHNDLPAFVGGMQEVRFK